MSHVVAAALTRKPTRFAVTMFAFLLLSTASGCLSIGGKTEVVASPENDMRLTSLESRVGTLERTLGVSSVPTSVSADETKSSKPVRTASATSSAMSRGD